MKKKLLASLALVGLSMGSAQAVTLSYTDSHTFDGEVDFFYFDNNSAGSVSIWTDTLQDGFDSNGALFKLNSGTGKYDFLIDVANGAEVRDFDGLNQSGVNEFNVAIKNGYIHGDTEALGVSDTGGTLDLDAGSYLFTIAGFDFTPNAFLNGAGTVDDGFTDLNVLFFGGTDTNRQWSTWGFNTGGAPSSYEVYIEGDVSAVPVPAAVWMFASAIAGLRLTSRSKK